MASIHKIQKGFLPYMSVGDVSVIKSGTLLGPVLGY